MPENSVVTSAAPMSSRTAPTAWAFFVSWVSARRNACFVACADAESSLVVAIDSASARWRAWKSASRWKKATNASPASGSVSAASASARIDAYIASRTASSNACLVGKWRHTVPTPTPARRAISSTWALPPSSEKTSSAAASTRARLRRAAARIVRRDGSTSIGASVSTGSAVTGTMVPIIPRIRNGYSGCAEPDSARGLGLLDRELGRGVGAEPLVRDRRAALDRASVRAVGQPLLGPLDGRETVTQARDDGVVDLLAVQAGRGVGEVALVVGGVTGVLRGLQRRVEELLDPAAFVAQQRSGFVVVHGRKATHARDGRSPSVRGSPLADVVRDRGDDHAAVVPEQEAALEHERTLVVQEVLPPVLDVQLGDDHVHERVRPPTLNIVDVGQHRTGELAAGRMDDLERHADPVFGPVLLHALGA